MERRAARRISNLSICRDSGKIFLSQVQTALYEPSQCIVTGGTKFMKRILVLCLCAMILTGCDSSTNRNMGSGFGFGAVIRVQDAVM